MYNATASSCGKVRAIFKATRSERASKSWLDCCWLLAAGWLAGGLAGSCGAELPIIHLSLSLNQACSPSLWRPGHLLRAHQDIHSTRTTIAPRAQRRLVQVQA